MEKKYRKKNARLPTFFFYLIEPLCEGGQMGEEKDGGERDGYGGGGWEEEFSYRRIKPSHFLRTFEGARGPD